MHWTDAYIGIPFEVKGRNYEGLDCWGLVRLIYKEMFNIDLPSFADKYIDLKDKALLEKLYAKHSKNGEGWTRVLKGQEMFGDVFLVPLVGINTHVCVCVEPGLMIHITEDINVTVEEYWNALWKKRFERATIYRHPKVYKV